jgi:hypothetical protein
MPHSSWDWGILIVLFGNPSRGAHRVVWLPATVWPAQLSILLAFALAGSWRLGIASYAVHITDISLLYSMAVVTSIILRLACIWAGPCDHVSISNGCWAPHGPAHMHAGVQQKSPLRLPGSVKHKDAHRPSLLTRGRRHGGYVGGLKLDLRFSSPADSHQPDAVSVCLLVACLPLVRVRDNQLGCTVPITD